MAPDYLIFVPVIAVVMTDDDAGVEEAIDDSVSRQDDAYWSRRVRGPFTWQVWLDWWVCRRWVIPRDIRKR